MGSWDRIPHSQAHTDGYISGLFPERQKSFGIKKFDFKLQIYCLLWINFLHTALPDLIKSIDWLELTLFKELTFNYQLGVAYSFEETNPI